MGGSIRTSTAAGWESCQKASLHCFLGLVKWWSKRVPARQSQVSDSIGREIWVQHGQPGIPSNHYQWADVLPQQHHPAQPLTGRGQGVILGVALGYADCQYEPQLRSRKKAVKSSATAAGSSAGAKCPPRGKTVHRWMLYTRCRYERGGSPSGTVWCAKTPNAVGVPT